MSITLRAEKGSELTHEEMDNNFKTLADGFVYVELESNTDNNFTPIVGVFTPPEEFSKIILDAEVFASEDGYARWNIAFSLDEYGNPVPYADIINHSEGALEYQIVVLDNGDFELRVAANYNTVSNVKAKCKLTFI